MPLRQTNALSENPDGLPMRIAGRYNRVVKASIARAWENVRDWEHLPWLHADSFSDCRLEEEGNWGWRAVTKGVGPAADQETVIELAIDADASRYVSRTLAGGLPGVEIWTRLTKLAAHQTQVDVEFHLPHLTEAQADKAGAGLVRLYTKLWDEDEAMMIARQEALDARDKSRAPAPVALGPARDLDASLPRLVQSEAGPVRLISLNGEIRAYPARCPHLKGPLQFAVPDAQGCITCPWHGYRFNVATGLSADGRGLSLGVVPQIRIDENQQAFLIWPQ
tara:strand:- start:1985 stop:2821 length:837 start_codon:yes stop_codon:yes gene_type:complete